MSYRERAEIYYREVQRFGQAWLWALVVLLSGLSWFAFFLQIVFGRPFGQNPAPDPMIWIILVAIGICLPILLFSVRLVTEVRGNGIYILFSPFKREIIRPGDIEEAKKEEVNPYFAYGGFGIRWAPGRGRAYIVGGGKGVVLKMRSGRRIFLGSRDPEGLLEAIERMRVM